MDLQALPSYAPLRVGDLLVVPKPGGMINHWGVLIGWCVDTGEPVIASASGEYQRVVTQSLSEFSPRSPHQRYRVAGRRLSDRVVVERALGAVGTRYSVTRANCEQFVRFVHGFEMQSPQLSGWLAAFGLGVAAVPMIMSRS